MRKQFFKLTLAALVFISFAQYSYAEPLTADLGPIGFPPSDLNINIPSLTPAQDLGDFFITFSDDQYLQLNGSSNIAFNFNINWDETEFLGFGQFNLNPGITFFDENGISLGSYISSVSGSYSPSFYSQNSFASDIIIAEPIYSFLIITDINTFATWGTSSVLSGSLYFNMSEVDGVVGAPVPEPSTFILLGGGLAGLALFARRKKNS